MAAFELLFEVEATTEHRKPDVRIWVDPDMLAGLGTETELALRSYANNCWSSAFTVTERASIGFMYRIGITADPGTVWSLEVRECGRAVLNDSDTVAMPKEWLVGTVQR
jgi:hypothetical protein